VAGANRPKPLATANTKGLISWWHADGNALDAVGGIDGTLSGTTRFGPGRIGEGFVFDGNGVVELGHPAKLQLQDFTVEAWVKRSRTAQTSPTPGGGEILSCGHNGYAMGMTDDGLLYLSAMEVSAVYSSVLIADLQFHHLAVTKTGQSVAFYIDGVFDRKVTYAGTFSFETALAIGGRGDAGGRFMGTIDELSVHDRALSAPEIQADYQAAAKEELPAPGAVIRLEAPMAPPRTTVRPFTPALPAPVRRPVIPSPPMAPASPIVPVPAPPAVPRVRFMPAPAPVNPPPAPVVPMPVPPPPPPVPTNPPPVP
jgi:hypothetical protein